MGTSADFTLVAPDPNTHADALYKKTEDYSDTGRWMAKVVDLGATLATLAPELERRLARSHLCDWEGRLLLD